jgi:DNA-binding MarR family transcriptional regulator
VLAERTGLSKQALIEVIDEMEARGYLTRIPDPGDRRAKLICLTELGMAVHEEAFGALSIVEADWTARMGRESLEELVILLQRLNESLSLDVHGNSRPGE